MEKQFNKILITEGLGNWKIKNINSGGGVCHHSTKEIWIDLNKYKSKAIFMFLHEVAHAKIDEKHQHNGYFTDVFTSLCMKYCLDKKVVSNAIDDISCHQAPNVCQCCEELDELKKELGLNCGVAQK